MQQLSLSPDPVLRRTPLAFAAVLAFALAGGACAQETDSPEAENAPVEIDSAEVGPASSLEAFDSAAAETAELMQTAGRRLADAQLDDETAQIHDDIVDRLRRLLEQAQQQAARKVPMPTPSPDSSATPDDSATGGTGEQGDRRRTDNAAESSDVPGGGDLSDGEIQRRRQLATSVWGHLPPREREKMEGAFSERFLPLYDDLVRQYYEALATEPEK